MALDLKQLESLIDFVARELSVTRKMRQALPGVEWCQLTIRPDEILHAFVIYFDCTVKDHLLISTTEQIPFAFFIHKSAREIVDELSMVFNRAIRNLSEAAPQQPLIAVQKTSN